MAKIIDLTYPIVNGMMLFGEDPETKLYKIKDYEKDGYNLCRLETCLHGGTHIDAPMHITGDKRFISDFPLDKFFGSGILLDVSESIFHGEITLGDIFNEINLEDKIVILKTGHSKKYGKKEYFEDYPVICEDLAKYFIEKRIKVLGIDMPSPDRYPFSIHNILLKEDILIMENVANLESLIGVGEFEVFAFPLRIDAEASFVRVVARVRCS